MPNTLPVHTNYGVRYVSPDLMRISALPTCTLCYGQGYYTVRNHPYWDGGDVDTLCPCTRLLAVPDTAIRAEFVPVCTHQIGETKQKSEDDARDRISEIVGQITYKPGWTLILKQDGDRPYIQVSVSDVAEASTHSCGPDKGKREPWKGGKVYLSTHMCRQEIVSACFSAFLNAEEHEVREWFRYKGASIYNPHLDPDVLVEIARKASSFNVRANAMTTDEPE